MKPYNLLPVLIVHIHSIAKSCPFYLQVYLSQVSKITFITRTVFTWVFSLFCLPLYILYVHIASRLRSLKHFSDHLITTHSSVSHSMCSTEPPLEIQDAPLKKDVNKFESDAYFITFLGNQFVITLKILIISLGEVETF